jgi:hypothetical protein
MGHRIRVMSGARGMNVRIVRARFKLLYLVVVIVFNLALGRLLDLFLPATVIAVVGIVISTLFWVIAVRVFRGSGEDLQRPRAWWRVTGGPASGIIVGAFVLLYAGTLAPAVISGLSKPQNPTALTTHFVFASIMTPLSLVICALYIHSSIRLIRNQRGSASTEGSVL